jgi:hypothetical protein
LLKVVVIPVLIVIPVLSPFVIVGLLIFKAIGRGG